MGGIIGKLSFDPEERLARPVLEQMLEAVADPGTRGRVLHSDGGIALGCCADDDVSSAQTATAHVHVVADSRLTNARELGALLASLGHALTTFGDAEIIAHAYLQWGDACTERLRGAFACAIWDERDRRLLLARDQAGLRPLAFAVLPGHGVVFASEIRALLQDPGVAREWCPIAVDAYLALGYVPAPLTAFRRVSKLEPAQRLIVDGRRLRTETYWDLPEPEHRWGHSASSIERLTPEIAAALEGALRRVIRRDVAEGVTGTLYSGGLASASLIVAGAAQAGDVVTIADARDTTEVAHGCDMARRLDCDLQVEITTPDVPVAIRQVASSLPEPVADPFAITQYAVCAAARPYTGCAFAAHGASALWGGTRPHGGGIADAVRNWTQSPEAHDRRALYTRTFAWQVRDANPFARHLELYSSRDTADPLERALYVTARTMLPDSRLVTAACAAAAAGMRLQFPFLDHTTLELACQVPMSLRHQGTGRLPVLRAILERRVPASMLPAAAAAVATPSWLRDAVGALVPSTLLGPRFDCRGIVSRPALMALWQEHLDGRADHAHRLWSLLMLEFWFREHIDGDAAEEPLEYAVLKAA